MTALEYLCGLPHVPMALNGNMPIEASNSERRRWLEHGAVLLNGTKPKPQDEISFPVTQLVFFPNGARRTTML